MEDLVLLVDSNQTNVCTLALQFHSCLFSFLLFFVTLLILISLFIYLSICLFLNGTYQDQDLSFNRNSRQVDATFAIGPNRHPLSLSITNTKTEGENDVKVQTDLFLLEEGIQQTLRKKKEREELMVGVE